HAVGGAKVTLPHDDCNGCEPDAAVSAADGTFAFTVPTARNVAFVVAAAGFPRQRFSFRLPDPSGAVQHEFLLQLGTAVAGRVLDLRTRAPLANASVQEENRVEITRTAADGTFRALVLPRDDSGAWLGVTAPDHCSLGLNLTAAEIAAGAELQVLLPAGVRLVGTVRDDAGKPVAEAQVYPNQSW